MPGQKTSPGAFAWRAAGHRVLVVSCQPDLCTPNLTLPGQLWLTGNALEASAEESARRVSSSAMRDVYLEPTRQ